MVIRLDGAVTERDLKPFSYPPLKELKKINCRSVCLGSFVPWDVKRQSKIIQDELGWRGDIVENVPPGYSYEKIECYMQGVRDYIKYIKRGYTRPTHLSSLDIRNNRLKRSDALKLMKEYEGRRPPSLDLFLDFIGLTEIEFMQISISHTISPWKFDENNIRHGQKVHDYDEWMRDGKMDRKQSKKQLSRWKEHSSL